MKGYKIIFAPVSFYGDIKMEENSYWDYRYGKEKALYIEATLPFMPMPGNIVDFEDMKLDIYKDWHSKLLNFPNGNFNNVQILIRCVRRKYNIPDSISDSDILDLMFGIVPERDDGMLLIKQYSTLNIFRVWRVCDYLMPFGEHDCAFRLSRERENTIFVHIYMEY